MNETLTVADVVRMGPCGLNGEDNGVNYTRHRIKSLWSGRERLTLLEVLDLDISITDRLWCVLQAVDRRTRAILACDFAGHVLPLFEAERDEELDAARKAAKAAACVASTTWDVFKATRAARSAWAAWDAAGAARNAARDARDAAWAAWDAAKDARDAAWADWAAELDWQLARTREVLEEDDDE